MSVIEKATGQMEAWAGDDSHGYDQRFRWGPDYDCSSAVIQAWELAGVPVKSKGASYTGNMYGAFKACGFADVTGSVDLANGSGLMRGDVLLNHKSPCAVYCGGGVEAEASINEDGGVTGGQPGDQTGREFLLRPYRNYPWDCVLRYAGAGEGHASPSYYYKVSLPLLKQGMEHPAVQTVQELLAARGYEPGEADGIMGEKTAGAVMAFQADAGLLSDGEVGGDTWAELLKGGTI